MLEQAIAEVQNIERSVARKTLSDLQNSLGLTLLPQGIARAGRRVPPAAREQLNHRSPPRLILVIEIRKRLPVGQRQLKALGIDAKLCSANDFVLWGINY